MTVGVGIACHDTLCTFGPVIRRGLYRGWDELDFVAVAKRKKGIILLSTVRWILGAPRVCVPLFPHDFVVTQ